jgi:hypothetical protein
MSAPADYLSVCAVYRNEGPYLREWVAFHRAMGVERFYLYNNRSEDDGHREALAPYVDEGLVTVYEWPDCLPPNVFAGEAVQTATYQHCIQHHAGDSRWIAFIDLDEFLFSPTGNSLPDMLVEYERWPGVGVNWVVFGASGHRTQPDGLVIENYVRHTLGSGYNRAMKCVIDPQRVRNFCLAHFFIFHGEPRVVVDEHHRPIEAKPGSGLSMTDENSVSRLRINHYATRSDEEFRRKLARVRVDNGRPWNFTEAQIARRLKVLDQAEDRTIQMYLPALRSELARVEQRAVPSPPSR